MRIKYTIFTLSISMLLLFACNSEQRREPSTDLNPPNVTGIGNVVIPEKEAKEYIDHFDKKFRRKGGLKNDTLSEAVWFNKKAIHFLDSIMQKDSTIDGVRAYFAAYNKMVSPGQKFNDQTTLIFVPTNKNGNYHRDNWNILPPFFPVGGLNHGSLCPDDCTQ